MILDMIAMGPYNYYFLISSEGFGYTSDIELYVIVNSFLCLNNGAMGYSI